MDDAVAKGAKVVTGGKARPDLGPFFYEPTVLENVTEDMALCREETFGPVVALYRFRDVAEALDQANDTAYGLNASVWTGDPAKGRALAARIKAGTVNVNEGYASAYGSFDAPMGGMKNSGLGRRHGLGGAAQVHREPDDLHPGVVARLRPDPRHAVRDICGHPGHPAQGDEEAAACEVDWRDRRFIFRESSCVRVRHGPGRRLRGAVRPADRPPGT